MKANILRSAVSTSVITLVIAAAAWADEVNVLTSSPDSQIRLRIDGSVVAKNAARTGTLNDTGAGVRMLWYPGKAAFRAGEITTASPTLWDENQIGLWSFAAGLNPKAAGSSSVALGDTASAGSTGDVAIGWHSTAYNGVAIGSQGSAYYYGYVFGTNSAANGSSTALGYSATATGGSAALGTSVTASTNSAAVGTWNTASNYSMALGSFTTATGKYSTSLGYSTTAQSFASTALGQFNAVETTNSVNTWVGTDLLFVIGNGTSSSDKKNAFVVRKNGDVIISKVQGDILMGEFGN